MKAKEINITNYEKIAVISRAVEIIHKKTPRKTQILSLICLLNKDPQRKGRLEQINTGEGKSMIVAMFAAIKALEGLKVDVSTTSIELSIPEVFRQRPFFQILDLTVS